MCVRMLALKMAPEKKIHHNLVNRLCSLLEPFHGLLQQLHILAPFLHGAQDMKSNARTLLGSAKRKKMLSTRTHPLARFHFLGHFLGKLGCL